MESNLLKRAVALQQTKDMAPFRVDADAFTDFMRSLQPEPRTTPTVSVQCYDVTNAFHASLVIAIRNFKKGKSPGSDLIRTEMFRLSPELFADASLELWRAVGRTAHVPLIFRSGLLSPIYKQKGEDSILKSKRTVCLTSSFRLLIGTAEMK